jgi:cytochrome b561
MNKYNINLRILHWVIALIFISIFASGVFMVGLDSKTVSYKYDIYALHKSFGVVALILVFHRVMTRLTSKTLAYSDKISKVNLLLAKATHFILYFLMIMIPLTGFLMSMLGGKGIMFFGWKIPMFLPEDKDIAGLMWSIHVKIPYVMAGFVVLHILAAAKHYFIDKDEVWNRISLGK